MSFVYIDVKNRMPIYEQLVENISKMVLSGVFLPNEPIPSVRQLASELGINPNTIQKAYAELERRNIIYSSPGRGSFVSDDISALTEKRSEEIKDSLRILLTEAKSLGFARNAAISLIDEIYL